MVACRLPILWPLNVHPDGVCYGWTHPLICVAGVIQIGDKETAVEVLQRVLSGDTWAPIQQLCGQSPTILGRCSVYPLIHDGATRHLPQLHLEGEARPREYDQPMIYYKRPNRAMMQFYSFGDGELDILPSREALDILGSKTDPARATLEHDFSRPAFNAQPALDATVLSQLNVAQLLADLVERAIHTTGHAPEDERSGAQLLHDPTPRIPTQTTSRLPKWLTRLALPMPMVLRDISATAEQINVRTEQALFVMTQSTTFMQRDSSRTIDFISRYVKFYNCVWLVLNDIIIGVAFGSFLCENRLLLSRILDQCVQLYLVDSIKHALLWLDNWPAGLKLNTELSQFYCHTLLSVVSIWGYVLQCAAPYFPVFLWIAGTMGGCGMTMVVSLLSDALGFLTAHLYVCYLLTTTAFSQQLSLAGSLWNLFRGKRFNVLRNRLDSWDYDIDQLLLGTILFTLVAFLSPTVLTYYALFAATHLSTITLCAILDTVIALLNHFPLFALMLRIKDPMRLPGQVAFRRLAGREESLILENQPASLSSMFVHYAHVWSCLVKHYGPGRVLCLLLSGRRLTRIPRTTIHFSMVPKGKYDGWSQKGQKQS